MTPCVGYGIDDVARIDDVVTIHAATRTVGQGSRCGSRRLSAHHHQIQIYGVKKPGPDEPTRDRLLIVEREPKQQIVLPFELSTPSTAARS